MKYFKMISSLGSPQLKNVRVLTIDLEYLNKIWVNTFWIKLVVVKSCCKK
jgi:hypothetical protein